MIGFHKLLKRGENIRKEIEERSKENAGVEIRQALRRLVLN